MANPTRLSVHEAAAAVFDLINASPRTPTPDQIAATLAAAMAPKPDGDEELLFASAFEFQAIPVEINLSAMDIGMALAPALALSVSLMACDTAGARDFVRDAIGRMGDEDPAVSLADMQASLDGADTYCRALLETLEIGGARFLIGRAQAEEALGIAPPIKPPIRPSVPFFGAPSKFTRKLRETRLALDDAISAEVAADGTPHHADAKAKTRSIEAEFDPLRDRVLSTWSTTLDHLAQAVEVALVMAEIDEAGLTGVYSECPQEQSMAHLLQTTARIFGSPLPTREAKTEGQRHG
jgi:hypothetical protein